MKKQINKDSLNANSSALKKKTEISKISAMVEDSMKNWNPGSEKNTKGVLRLLNELKEDSDDQIKSKFKSELMQEVLSKQPTNFGVPEAKIIKKDGTEGESLSAKIDRANEFSKKLETEMEYTKIIGDAITYLQGYNASTKERIKEHDKKIEKLDAELNSGIVNRIFRIKK